MTITKIETKTFYSVEISLTEMMQMHVDYRNGETAKICYPKAYLQGNNNITFADDLSLDDYRKYLDSWLLNPPHGETYDYIAHQLGYDGWSYGGRYNKIRNCYQMTLYNYGNHINN